jgi:hypothetical protein
MDKAQLRRELQNRVLAIPAKRKEPQSLPESDLNTGVSKRIDAHDVLVSSP